MTARLCTLGLALAVLTAGCVHDPASRRPVPRPESGTTAAAEDGSSDGSHGWRLPVSTFGDDAVLSGFGDPRDRGTRRHQGIDILAPRGTPVVAPFAGVVVVSADRGRAGNVVILRDFNDYVELVFVHLDRRAVRRGQQVRAGERLGTVGNTGNAAGGPPHLHFEMHDLSGPVDPYPLLAAISRQ